MADSTNYARDLFKALRAASTAPLKPGAANGGVSFTVNYVTRVVTGSFEFPLVESPDPNTGGINFEVADFLEVPTEQPSEQE